MGGGGWKLQGEKLLVTEKSLFHKGSCESVNISVRACS